MRKNFLPFNRFVALAVWMAFAGLSGCYKSALDNFGEEEIIIENTALGIEEADDALEVAYYAEAVIKPYAGGEVVLTCGTLTDDAVNHVLTIDFGSTPCTSVFGRQRRGKILVQYYSTLTDSLSNRTITFENYVVNNTKVSGTVALHDSSVENDTIYSTRSVSAFKVEFINATDITFNGDNPRRWTGWGDSLVYNNIYRFEGSMGGFSSSGHTFVQNITTTVVANFYCAYQGTFARTTGVVELSELSGYPNRQRTATYGTGTCDKTISIETFRRTYGMGTN